MIAVADGLSVGDVSELDGGVIVNQVADAS